MKFALFPLELTNCVLDITFPIEWLNLIGIITILNTERMIAIIRGELLESQVSQNQQRSL